MQVSSRASGVPPARAWILGAVLIPPNLYLVLQAEAVFPVSTLFTIFYNVTFTVVLLTAMNAVDGDQVPVRHFGCVLDMDAWRRLRDRLTEHEVEFIVGPRVRFEGRPGEQATLFIRDPSGNALEFKAFADLSRLFAPQAEGD